MDERIEKAGKQLVVKSNDFIQKKRHNLSLSQQKILSYAISKVKPGDIDFTPTTLSISEFCELCGHSTPDYSFVKEVAMSLYQNCFWYDDLDANKSFLYTWIENDMVIDKGQGTITLRLSEKLKPYLLGLRGNFTQYQLVNVLSLKSKYSIRLYEILKSYQNIDDNVVFQVDRLRVLLMCEDSYQGFKSFNQHVLTKAIDDINNNTDLNIFTYSLRTGRNVTAVGFSICVKRGKP